MYENENLVTEIEQEDVVQEEVAENVEHTTEQTEKTYTEAEFNAKLDEVLGKKIARKEAKIRKEYDSRYGRLAEVVKAGVGNDNLDEATEFLANAYAAKGRAPRKPQYTNAEIEVLATAEADDIIRAGFDEVVEEVDRLAQIGAANMSAREKAVFKALAEHRQNAERVNELTQIGVTEDVYGSAEFKDFAGKFNPNTSIRDIYDLYEKTKPKKEFKTMGSMKNSDSGDNGVKDFYTVEEARRFTKKDFDKNPALFAAVEKSMLKW
jgi:hypothetical protein